MARTQGSGWGGGVILYQVCTKCNKKKAYYSPMPYDTGFGVPKFKCTSCKERFNSDTHIRKTYQ